MSKDVFFPEPDDGVNLGDVCPKLEEQAKKDMEGNNVQGQRETEGSQS